MPQPISIINFERFWSNVQPWGPSSCWEWVGFLDRHGYGEFRQRRMSERFCWRAHRVAYEQLVGQIPNGLDLDHLCRVRCCVNPDHLEPVTRSENLRRSPTKGRRIGLDGFPECVNGHSVRPDSSRLDKFGYTVCRKCSYDRHLEFKQRQIASLPQ